MIPMNTIYNEMGIRETVLSFGKNIEKNLKDRFEKIDEIAEYNQLKVIKAMQDNRVSAGCFNYASGYGYDDQGRDTLEKVYASIFHTESALCTSADHLRNTCSVTRTCGKSKTRR